MERRVLLAIFLAFIVLYGYQWLVPPPAPPPPAQAPAGAASAADAVAPAAAPAAAAAPPPAVPPPAEPVANAAQVLVGEASERDIRVETPEVIAVFTNRGARLKSWRLKNYLDGAGEPLELIPAAATQPLPFTLGVSDAALASTLNASLFQVTGASSAGAVASNPIALTFEYRDTAGVEATKSFRVDPGTYIVAFRASVSQSGRAVPVAVQWGPAIESTGTETSSWIRGAGGVAYVGGELERIPASDIAAQPVREGDFRYVGVEDHYFLTVAVRPGVSRATFQAVALPPPAGSEQAARNLVAYTVEAMGEAADADRVFFIGPKDFDLLAATDPELVRAIDFGMFAFLVVPLLRALNWLNGYIGNYGFSIIALTILINAVMFPLRHKSVVSMRKMQEIQPEAKAIQERYSKLKATDPAKQKMNQELMALYRERGVNPASGCIPMLLTFPVLLAFYSLLTVSIELRGAPFAGWIHDLSLPDPFYIIPVLMGATQMWQMKLTPQAGVDPAQQKLMMFMPLMFIVFMLWAPSGVVLYWFVSNVWGIGQQYATNYIIGPPNIRAVRPPAERRMKKVGAGKTNDAAGNEK